MNKSRGIVITVPKKYEQIALLNVQNIRKMNCNFPIEIWEIGQEITPETRVKFSKIENLSFRQVSEFSDNPQHWKGFQVKVFAFYYTDFQEVLLCDADVLIHQNPTLLFEVLCSYTNFLSHLSSRMNF